jgi:acetolactate synthase-1/2/3 large subunit
VTSGPGGSNAWTGTLCSYQDSIPVMVLSGNVNKSLTTNFTGLDLRQLGDQEFNVVKTVKNFTKYAIQVNDASTIQYHLEKAYHLATTGRPGPVWIDIPLDVQTEEINLEDLIGYTPEDNTDNISEEDIDLILQKLLNSKKPLIIAGHGVRLSKSVDLLDLILKRFKIPVVTSFNGNDAVDNEYEYYCGRFGTHAQIAANNILQEADFILSLGSRLYVRQIGYNFSNFAKNAYKVYIDIDKNELYKPTIFPDVRVNCNVYDFLDNIKHKISTPDITEWRTYCKELTVNTPTVLNRHRKNNPLSIYAVIECFNNTNKHLPIITSDGSANIVGMQVLKLKKHQRLFSNKSTAPMGYGLPAAIGACIANGKQPVLCLEGDGSLHMNIHELQVVVQNKLPIKLVVFNNDGYLSIKITQKSFCNGLLSVSDSSSGLTLPSYKKLAEAYGIKYKSIISNENIQHQINECFETDEPQLIEIFVSPNELHEPKVIAHVDNNRKITPGKLENIQWLN